MEINKIYNMDYREGFKLLGDNKVDLIATDPPYNIGFKYNEYTDNLAEEEYINMFRGFKNLPLAIIHYPEETMRYIVPALGSPMKLLYGLTTQIYQDSQD